MKVAYCVLCHRNSIILEELIYQLKDEDIYIHVDKKSDINEFNLDSRANNIKFLNDRVDVRWGDYSTILAIINLLKEIKDKNYDYVFLLSGDCLPLKDKESIKKYLSDNIGKEYLGVMDINEDNIKNIKYLYREYAFKKNKNIFEKIFFKFQRKFGFLKTNKYFKYLPSVNKGCLWFTLTGECCKYILEYIEKNPKYLNAFKGSYCGDEMFIQTIVCNSKFKNRLNDIDLNDNYMALRYIDWETGPDLPKVLDESDFERIINSNKNVLFARKFSEDIDIKEYRKFLEANSN